MLRSAYNYDRESVSFGHGTDFSESEDMAQQSFKEECDINTIVRRFGVTGAMMQNVSPPTYQTFDGIFDYHTAMNAIAKARESFDAMSADVRARFKNDPQEFVKFCSDEKNLDEMRKMGLAVPAKSVDNAPVVDVPPEQGDSHASDSGKRVGKSAKAAPGSAKAAAGNEGES